MIMPRCSEPLVKAIVDNTDHGSIISVLQMLFPHRMHEALKCHKKSVAFKKLVAEFQTEWKALAYTPAGSFEKLISPIDNAEFLTVLKCNPWDLAVHFNWWLLSTTPPILTKIGQDQVHPKVSKS